MIDNVVAVFSPVSFVSSFLFFLSPHSDSKTSTLVDSCTRFVIAVRVGTEGLDAARDNLVAGLRTDVGVGILDR